MLRLFFLAVLCTYELRGDPAVDRISRLEHTFQREVSDLREKVTFLEEKVTSLEVQSELEVSAAFSTRLHEDTTIGDGPVVFGTVDLNIGDGYDEFTGVFEPPLDGVYLLTVYAVTDSAGYGPIFIKNNDEVLCQGYITDGLSDADTAACSAIAELTTEDSVRVTGDSGSTATIRIGQSGFAGHIIQNN